MPSKLFAAAALAAVVAGCIVAFRAIGTPSYARDVALDRRRVEDLFSIAQRLHERFGGAAGTLPPALSDGLTDDVTGRDTGQDPVSRKAYEYRRLSKRRYELCATFVLPSENGEGSIYDAKGWRHGAGRTCYAIDVQSDYPFR